MNDPVKLIAVDMDGTLLRSDKTVDPRTVDDIQAAAEQGVTVVYCSGRGIAEMEDTFRDIPIIRYAVCTSGAVVYDREEDRFIYRNGIGRSYIRQIIDMAARYRAMPHYLTDRESIVTASDITHMEDFHMGVYRPMFMKISRRVRDMVEEGLQHEVIEKINIYFRSVEDRKAGYDEMKQLPIKVSLSENTTLEMTALSTDKGTGLKRLAEHLHIPMSRTAAIGDNYNDAEMLKAAGLPIAMGNAIPGIREMCSFVTADNDSNGTGLAIRAILKRNKSG